MCHVSTHEQASSHRWSEFAFSWFCKQIQYFISTAPSHASIIDTTWKSGNWFFLGTVCRNMQPVSPFLMGALTEQLTITSNEPSPDVQQLSSNFIFSPEDGLDKMDYLWPYCNNFVKLEFPTIVMKGEESAAEDQRKFLLTIYNTKGQQQ